MTYDELNRMLSHTGPGGSESFTYRGAEWHRASADGKSFLCDGDNVLADISGGVTDAFYVTPFLDQNLSMTTSAGTYYYSQDGLGSVRTLTDAAGAVVNSYDYLPFGRAYQPGTSVTVEQRYTYTGRELNPASALMYYRYRQYDPRVGRFGARDPVGYGGGLSIYLAFNGNPSYWTDRYGRLPGESPWPVPPPLPPMPGPLPEPPFPEPPLPEPNGSSSPGSPGQELREFAEDIAARSVRYLDRYNCPLGLYEPTREGDQNALRLALRLGLREALADRGGPIGLIDRLVPGRAANVSVKILGGIGYVCLTETAPIPIKGPFSLEVGSESTALVYSKRLHGRVTGSAEVAVRGIYAGNDGEFDGGLEVTVGLTW